MKAAIPRALFRCDASSTIGAGHVTRCLALAEALAEAGWVVGFAVGPETMATVPTLAMSGFEISVIDGTVDEIESLRRHGQMDLLIVDHYGRDVAFEGSCRSFARKILVLDDATGRKHGCDILVDAAATDPECYLDRVPSEARVLIGPSYALLRSSFIIRRAEALCRHEGRSVARILISCGATDPTNATSVILDALHEAPPGIAIDIALSSGAPNLEAVRGRLRKGARIILDADDMAGLVLHADIGIGGAGTSAYERAALGLPSILLALADNQRPMMRMLASAGAAIDGGDLNSDTTARLRRLTGVLLADSDARLRMARCASRLVDGHGAERIVLSLLEDTIDQAGTRITLRLAAPDDETWLLTLQCQPQTRRFFRNPGVPTAQEHHRWMEKTLSNPAITLLMIERNGMHVGMVRLDRNLECSIGQCYDISIAIDSGAQGLGIASAALVFVRRLRPIAVFRADIVASNTASKELFLRAGFAHVHGDHYQSLPL
jgi:UDP-2,4-diacetamido-2,4,6-trideoxy-beta-L-altropyranose hydrolase